MSRPNILFIHSDQHRFDCLGVNGNPLLKTPALDQLAEHGMNFLNAFTPIPLCVPARNCLLHGQWPTEHLAIANYDTEAPRPPEAGLPCFSQQLRDQGYFLGYVAKWHVAQERDPFAYGFHEYVPEWDYHTWRQQQGLPPVPCENTWFGEVDAAISASQSRLAWGADHIIRLLRQAADGDAPFFLRWDPAEPHLPNVVPEPYAGMYPPKQIRPWPSFPDPLDRKPYIQRQQRRTWKVDEWTWEQWAPIVGRYLGDISLLDAQIGRILSALDALKLADNTLVMYTTDHGDMCGGHGMIDKHFIMYDDVVRVPMIMRWPGRIAPGSRCEAFVSHEIDLATTLCDVAEASVPDTFQGQSLLPLMQGEQENERQDIFSMYHGNQFGLYSQRMVRDRRWKYIWNATAEDELYDLETDPGELRNLATHSACAGTVKQFRRRMVEWMEATSDPLLNPWIKPQLLEGLTV